jgi:Holliday junction resolvase RusA-like endonuclease
MGRSCVPIDRVSFTVPGEPKGKGRPRFSSKTGHAYTPARTRAYEAEVAKVAKIAMQGHKPFHGACTLLVIAYMPIPKSWPKAKREAAREGCLLHTGTPDYDNIGKVMDALNKIVWNDDAQVIDGRILKAYSDEPRLKVSVVHLDAGDRGIAFVPTEDAPPLRASVTGRRAA